MTGRPCDYTQEIADEICDRLAKGESLRTICADEEAGWLPNRRSVQRWLGNEDKEFDGFRLQYARAREAQADHFVDEIVSIADSPNVTTGKDGEVIANDPQRDRLRIDARKWVASKLAPKRYGEKLDLNHSGEVAVTSLAESIQRARERAKEA